MNVVPAFIIHKNVHSIHFLFEVAVKQTNMRKSKLIIGSIFKIECMREKGHYNKVSYLSVNARLK